MLAYSLLQLGLSPSHRDPHRRPILPARRTRRLTLDLSQDNNNNHNNTCAQSQSRFFTQLPPEIRRLIYLELFGSREIHFFHMFSPSRRQWEPFHCVCPVRHGLGIFGDACYEGIPLWWERQLFSFPLYIRLSVSILFACRLASVYSTLHSMLIRRGTESGRGKD